MQQSNSTTHALGVLAFPNAPLERSPKDEGTAEEADGILEPPGGEGLPANHTAQTTTNRTITRIDRWEPRGSWCGKCWKTERHWSHGPYHRRWLVSDVLEF
jgi:hypothetical protein